MDDVTFRDSVRRLVPWLLAATIISGVGLGALTVLASYRGHRLEPSAFALMLLLLLFALGTMTTLLFVTKENFTASMPGFTLALSGPAALWFGGTLMLISVPSIHDNLFDSFSLPTAVDALEQDILSIERKSDWTLYRDWKDANKGEFYEQLIKNEGSLLSELLENAFTFPSPADKKLRKQRPLLVSPHISTVFLYFPDYVLKFQMISGHQEADTDGANIFFSYRANADTEKGATKALLIGDTSDDLGSLVGMDHGVTEATVQEDHYGWEHVPGKNIRCLNIVKYHDGGSAKQDRILVDMKKFSYDTGGQMDLAILNYDRIVKAQIWRMKGSVGTTAQETPLLFRESGASDLTRALNYLAGETSAADDNGPYPAHVISELTDWFKVIDVYLDNVPLKKDDATAATQAFLRDIKKEMISSLQNLGYGSGKLSDSSKFEDLLQIRAKGHAAFHGDNVTDVSVVLVRPTTPGASASLSKP
jgi:hypothetical protein